jgi:hypothetical protein
MRNETQILKVKKEIQEKLWLMNNIHRKIYDEAINKFNPNWKEVDETSLVKEKKHKLMNKFKDDDDWKLFKRNSHSSDGMYGIEKDLKGKLSSIKWVLGEEWEIEDD